MDAMHTPENVDEPRRAAIERLKNRRSFGQHVVCYVVVNAFLIGIWFTTGAGYFWPGWVIGGWGIGLVMHAWTAFFQRPITEADVAQEMKRGGTIA
jgi:protein-S-isoprenylcysteine O-methyltransferase Ste14